MTSRNDRDDALGYAAALEELEAILAELEHDDVDVDVLAPKVRRAAELIAICRAHIGAARLDVERIVADLDDPSAPPGPADEPESWREEPTDEP